MSRAPLLAALVLMFAYTGQAQSPSARFSISGVVQDQAGAAIAGAPVESGTTSTPGAQSTTTDQAGRQEKGFAM